MQTATAMRSGRWMQTATAMRSGRWMQTKTQTASHPPRLPHDQPRPHPSHHHQACQQTYSHRTSPPRSSGPQPAPPHPTLLRSRPQQTRAPQPVADHSIARHPIARHTVAHHSPVTLLPTGLPTAKPTVKHQTPHTNPAPHPASPTNHQQPQRAHVTTAQEAQQPTTTPTPPTTMQAKARPTGYTRIHDKTRPPQELCRAAASGGRIVRPSGYEPDVSAPPKMRVFPHLLNVTLTNQRARPCCPAHLLGSR